MISNYLKTSLSVLLALATNASFSAETLPAIFRKSFEIGGQFYDYQNYSSVPYFHGGLDLCTDSGTEVFTPVSGRVTVSDYKITASARPHSFSYARKPFRRGDVSSTRYLEVAITEKSGRIWMFRHIDPTSVPDTVFRCAASSSILGKGSMIGRVGAWIQPVLPEKRIYDHIHLEIMAADGSYLNPARFVKTAKDHLPPVIYDIYAAKHGTHEAVTLTSGLKTLSGTIDLIIGVTDRMNTSAYQHAVYASSWSLTAIHPDKSETMAIHPREVFRFDQLPFKGERVQLSKVIYRDSIQTPEGTIKANGSIGPRFFLVNLTCGAADTGYSETAALQTATLANGTYRLNVSVRDYSGNRCDKSVEFRIQN